MEEGEKRGGRAASERAVRRRRNKEAREKASVESFLLSLSYSLPHLRGCQRGPRRDQREHRQGQGAPIAARRGRAGEAAPACRRHSFARSTCRRDWKHAGEPVDGKRSKKRTLPFITTFFRSSWPRDHAELRHRNEPGAQQRKRKWKPRVCLETTRARLVFSFFFWLLRL